MGKDYVILGIHDGHGAGAALIKNGRVLAAISEERLRNMKNYSGPPVQAIREVFKISGVPPQATTLVAIAGLVRATAPLEQEDSLKVKLFRSVSRLLHSHWFSRTYVSVLHRFRRVKEIESCLRELGIEDRESMYFDHHLCHAASAYYERPWNDDTLILTLDGAGDGKSATVNVGCADDITCIDWTTHYDSISNNMYSEITGYLGLKRWEHEYKIMGMAPYGMAEYCSEEMKRICSVDPKHPLRFKNTFGPYGVNAQSKLRSMLAGKRFDNISAACQERFENLVEQWVKNAVDETGIRKIATSGGSFLNVKANSLLRDLPEVEDIFFHPACGDEGTPVGAALLGYHQLCKRDGIKPDRYPLEHLYLGRNFSETAIEDALSRFNGKIEYSTKDDIEEFIAQEVSDGKIVARFNGREEFGPRALGNRSIIADPRDLRVIRKLNFAIKYRDFWMPFAPSIVEDEMPEFFLNPRPARYMIEAFPATERGQEIPAALHPYDYTGRPHSVPGHLNKGWYDIISTFGEITGVPVILNTSFNLHGSPIVGSPEVAVHTLLSSELDYLAIGNHLVKAIR